MLLGFDFFAMAENGCGSRRLLRGCPQDGLDAMFLRLVRNSFVDSTAANASVHP